MRCVIVSGGDRYIGNQAVAVVAQEAPHEAQFAGSFLAFAAKLRNDISIQHVHTLLKVCALNPASTLLLLLLLPMSVSQRFSYPWHCLQACSFGYRYRCCCQYLLPSWLTKPL